jgi:hypothetical protein
MTAKKAAAAFLDGLTQMGTLAQPSDKRKPSASDPEITRSLARDWAVIGQDMNLAIKKTNGGRG